MLLYALISFPFIWLAVATLVATACRMAAQADESIPRADGGALREPGRDQTGVTGLRLAGQSRRLPAASA